MKNVKNGSCLTRDLETQALDSTGFHNSLRQLILDLDASKTAYGTISVEDAGTRCLFVASLIKWAYLANYRLLDYLEKIGKGECDEVLTLNYAKLCNKDYWLNGRMKNDMMAYSDKPLKEYLELCNSDDTSMNLYQLYETNVCELADNLKKVENTFDQPQLYDSLMQQLKRQYADPFIEYEYAKIKESYIEPTLDDYLKMQVTACIELLHTGMLSDVLSISYKEIQKVDEEKLRSLLDPSCKVPANLKELWAKFMKLMVYKADVLLVPKREKIRIQVLKHFDHMNEDQFKALFRLDDLLQLIHQDMVKLKPELAKALNSTINEQPVSNQQEPNEELFHFIHPSVDDEEGLKIHNEVKRLVTRQSVQMICHYLLQMRKDNKTLLPPNPSAAYVELVRMGMPSGEGFTESTFRKYYSNK